MTFLLHREFFPWE